MCCDLCPEFEDCEDVAEGPEYCCSRCPEYEDCPTRLEMDYTEFNEEGDIEDFDF